MALPLINVFLRQTTSFRTFGKSVKSSYRVCNYSSTPCLQQVSQEQTDNAGKLLEMPEAESLNHDDYFNVRKLVTVRNLFKAHVHLGHKFGCREPYMVPYIYGTRMDQDILDLEQTKVMLQDALNFTAHITYRKGIVLFISRHHPTLNIVESTAKACGEYAHCQYWRGGTFTNATVQSGTTIRLPDLCIFMNVSNSIVKNHSAVIDSAKLLIPCVGIVDTNSDPRLITYPVPGNDDSPKAIQYYCSLFYKAIMAGKNKRIEDRLDD